MISLRSNSGVNVTLSYFDYYLLREFHEPMPIDERTVKHEIICAAWHVTDRIIIIIITASRMLKIAINSLDQLLLINGVQLMRRKVSWESERDANRAIQVGEEVDIVSKTRIFIESETCANPLRIANNSYNTQFSSTISCSKR